MHFSNLLQEKAKIFVSKFPKISLLVCFLCAVVFFGCYKFIDQDFTPEEYAAAKEKIVNEETNQDLCESLYTESWEVIDYADYDDENYRELLDDMNEYQYTMYVLYEFDSIVTEQGIGTYFYDTDGLFAEEIGVLLKKIGMEEMGNYYDEFFDSHSVDFSDFAVDVEQKDMESLYKNYRIRELNEKYELKIFDETFSKLNEKNQLIDCLADYGRKNVDQFGWERIKKEKLEAELLLGQ